MIFLFMQSLVRKSPLSAQQVQVRQLSQTSLIVFYDITDGKIRYDSININKIKKADLRRSLGIVLRDVNLFTGTVMEKVTPMPQMNSALQR